MARHFKDGADSDDSYIKCISETMHLQSSAACLARLQPAHLVYKINHQTLHSCKTAALQSLQSYNMAPPQYHALQKTNKLDSVHWDSLFG